MPDRLKTYRGDNPPDHEIVEPGDPEYDPAQNIPRVPWMLPPGTYALGDAMVTFDFDEEKHPRNPKGSPDGGRFVSPGDSAGAVAPLQPIDPEHANAQRNVLQARAPGLHAERRPRVQYEDLQTTEERGAAKAQIAQALASRMTSETGDLVNVAGYGIGGTGMTNLLQGDALDRRDYVNAGQTLRELTANDRYYAKISVDGPMYRIEWADTRGGATAGLTRDGWLPGNDPAVTQTIREAAASEMLQQWMMTSNDGSEFSLALQRNAAKEFGLTDTAGWPGEHFRPNAERDGVQRDFLRATYENTQEYLKANGVTEVQLSRGFQFGDQENLPEWATHGRKSDSESVTLRPLSAFSANPDTARQFAGPFGARVGATVPASRIWSTARTGPGALHENEYIVLGGTEQMGVRQSIVGAHTISGSGETFEYHPDQERGADGRWTKGDDSADPVASATDRMVAQMTKPDGGYTVNPRDGLNVTKGYAVATLDGEVKIPVAEFFSPPGGKERIKDWLRANADRLDADSSLMAGGWHDPTHNEIVLSASQVLADRDEAVALGAARDQQSIADLAAIHRGDWANAIIPTGGTGGHSG